MLSALPFLICALALSLPIAFAVAKAVCEGMEKTALKEMSRVRNSLKSLNAGEFEPLPTDGAFASEFAEINALNKNTQKTTARKARELEKLKVVLDNVAQGIVAMNGKNEIVFVNSRALEIFRDGESILSNALSALIADERLCALLEERTAYESFSFTHEYGNKTYDVSGSMIAETGSKGISRLIIFTDITAEKEMIRQKSDFFANASHELKTPITVMRGLTEILLSKEDIGEQEEKQISRIHKESLRMSSLISDMLKLSKLERSGEEEERVEVDLRETVQEVVAELAEAAKEKELTVRVTGEGKLQADPKKIFELVQNLCSNAVNYNKQQGRIEITITDEAETLTLAVADSGIGIEKEHLPRLCERFYRVDKSRSKKTGGTGLGLAIVKHICALYGAELSIASELGEGTCVTVRFTK